LDNEDTGIGAFLTHRLFAR